MKLLVDYIKEQEEEIVETLHCSWQDLFDAKLYVPEDIEACKKDVSVFAEAAASVNRLGMPFDVELDGLGDAKNSYIIINAHPSLRDPDPVKNLEMAVETLCNALETKCGGKVKRGRANYKKFVEKHRMG